MPKILINELDRTEAAGPAYRNFSVVVPGAVATDKTVDEYGKRIFDENGVYECTSAKEFKDNIGLTSTHTSLPVAGNYATNYMRVWLGSGTMPTNTLSLSVFIERYKDRLMMLEPAIDSDGIKTFKVAEEDAFAEDACEGYILGTIVKGGSEPRLWTKVWNENDNKWSYVRFNGRIALKSNGGVGTADVSALAPDSSKDPEVGHDKYKLLKFSDAGTLEQNEDGTELTYMVKGTDGTDVTISGTGDSTQEAFNALTSISDTDSEEIKRARKLAALKWSFDTKTNSLGYSASNAIWATFDIMADYYSLAPDEPNSPWNEAKAAVENLQNTYGNSSLGNNYTTTSIVHYGNQIAYNLLKLGYTVLYKKLPDSDHMADLSDAESDYWSALKDKVNYDFRYLVSGVLTGGAGINGAIKSLAHTRGDCVALLDIDEACWKNTNSFAGVINAIKEEASGYTGNGEFAACFAPSVTYIMSLSDDEKTAYGSNTTFPASFHFLACAAKARINFNEWYAIAGYTRGVADLAIKEVGYNFGSRAIDALAPRREDQGTVAVNLIANERGNYYIWGNRTAKKMEKEDLKASHFLNVREICTSIKKLVYVTCRKFTFDPNSNILWINFCNQIKPLLDKMRSDQGITDYRIKKVATKQKGVLKALIRIIPIEAVEDFSIMLTLEDQFNGDISVEIQDI